MGQTIINQELYKYIHLASSLTVYIQERNRSCNKGPWKEQRHFWKGMALSALVTHLSDCCLSRLLLDHVIPIIV